MAVAEETVESVGVGKRVAKATGAILFGQMAAKLLGAVEKPLMAARFGTGVAADAFGAAIGLVLTMSALVEQLLQHSFMPTFIQTRTRAGEKESWRLASTVLNLIALSFLAIGGMTLLFAPQIVGLATDFRNPSATRLTEFLLRIMVPALVILPVSSLTYVILNSYKIFGLPAAADVAFKSGTVLALLFLAAKMGIPALAAGVVFGTVVKVGLHLFGLRHKVRFYRPMLDLAYGPVRTVGVLALPLLLGNFLGAIRPLWDNWLASGLAVGGAVAALRYGRALVDTPAQIFPLALRRALFPFMSEMAARDERERLTELLVRSLRVVAFVFLPMTVAMLLLRYPIVEAIYQWGKFSKESTELVVPVMTAFTLGLLAMGAEMILLEPYFAQSDTLTPTKIGVVTFFLHLGLTWVAVQILGWGAGGIALGYTLARTTKVIILACGLRRRLAPVSWRPLLAFTGRLGLAVAVMGGALHLALSRPVLPRSLLLLERTHLRDHGRLLVTLADPTDSRAPISQSLLVQFSPETRRGLEDFYASLDPPQSLKEALATDLNRILQGPSLYDDERFADVTLKEEVWRLLDPQRPGAATPLLNRLLLEAAFPRQLPPLGQDGSQDLSRVLFRPEDLGHRGRFLASLQQANDPVARYVVSRLSPETRRQLEAYSAPMEPPRALRSAVVADLNRILQGEILYDDQRFAGISLTRETRRLLARRPQGTLRVWLNRLLLEEAYRDEIAPPSKWVDLIRLAVPSMVGIVVFVLFCLVLRVEEATYVLGAAWRRVLRR